MSILNQFRLDGRLALITGASRGIGLALAVGLAEAGADIVAVSATMPEDPAASEIGRAVTKLGRKFRGLPCDMRDRQAIYAMLKRATIDSPPINILLCNAGTIRRKPAAEHPDEMWDEVLNVNLTAPFIIARELGKGMVERGRGKIIFTASLLSFQGGLTVPGYAASKGGIARLTMALANEWAGRGVNVNAIVPGYIATDNTQALRADPVRSGQILARIPAGRWGEPDDFKGAAVYLASDAARYVHGALLAIDGGWLGR
ncbi:MAG TPA: SDR family NAD(P)-dependent oxidoreductase [Polyangia bacterium]|jgi:2-deoxy-D-gluconate 3-dehydrogenase|nr:SDR family NAD(P)-dependent oxidoreductase [Polyangia bacterium]